MIKRQTPSIPLSTLVLFLCCLVGSSPALQSQSAPKSSGPSLLKARSYHHYFTAFTQQEKDFLNHDPPRLDWPWFTSNIPLLDVPDKALEETYYFRWYSFHKHIRALPTDVMPRGFVIDEFLDNVPWAGKWNSIDAAASMHLREARWLRNPAYAEQYARFWFTPDGDPRRYSFPVADSVYAVYLANADASFAISLLANLVHNYGEWEATHLDPNGLFWQIDDRDGMEDSIGGSGYRPTINSYMYSDAIAISKLAAMAGDPTLSQQYSSKAQALRDRIESKLWNPEAGFYETLPRGPDTHLVNVRELIGYLPWLYDAPNPSHDVAWKQLTDHMGFAGAYGPTTAERRSYRYRFSDPHECLWNGPSWPFATTQTLAALANLLNSSSQSIPQQSSPVQSVINPEAYFTLLTTYAHSQRIRTPDGKLIPWIDEDLDPDTGQWIARTILESHHQLPANRGRYYNHSGFADLIITGLIGLRPGASGEFTIQPLVPQNTWTYFALDGVPYHAHSLTIFYDKTGKHYHRGAGLHILCDGIQIGSSSKLGSLTVQLP
jgi:hypothetical protein